MKLDAHFDMLPLRAFQRDPRGHILPQGGKGGGGSAPAPDPAIGQAQNKMADLATKEYEDFMTNVWPTMQEASAAQITNANQQIGIANEQVALDRAAQEKQNAVADQQLEIMRQQQRITEAQYNRYMNTFAPVEDSIVSDAMNYDTAGNRERLASEALGDVNAQFGIARENTKRNMASYGIDPTSGVYAGNINANDVTQAATAAAAATRARDAAIQLGWAKKMDAAGLGRGVFGNSATAAGLALAGGAGASNSFSAGVNSGAAGLNASSTALNNGQIPISNASALGASYAQGYGSANNGWGGVGNLGLGSYGTQVNAWSAQRQADAQSSAGWGKGILGLAGAAMSGGAGGFATSALGQIFK